MVKKQNSPSSPVSVQLRRANVVTPLGRGHPRFFIWRSRSPGPINSPEAGAAPLPLPPWGSWAGPPAPPSGRLQKSGQPPYGDLNSRWASPHPESGQAPGANTSWAQVPHVLPPGSSGNWEVCGAGAALPRGDGQGEQNATTFARSLAGCCRSLPAF